MTTDRLAQTDPFDRIVGALSGLPGVKQRRPTTVMDVLPIAGNVTTYVVQSMRIDDGNSTKVVAFLQIVDSEGRARIVLPDKVVAAIVRQREALFDRSTPQSRARKAAAKARAAKRDAKAKRAQLRSVAS